MMNCNHDANKVCDSCQLAFATQRVRDLERVLATVTAERDDARLTLANALHVTIPKMGEELLKRTEERDTLRRELSEAEAVSEGRRKTLFEKAEELRSERLRADRAEVERDTLRRENFELRRERAGLKDTISLQQKEINNPAHQVATLRREVEALRGALDGCLRYAKEKAPKNWYQMGFVKVALAALKGGS